MFSPVSRSINLEPCVEPQVNASKGPLEALSLVKFGMEHLLEVLRGIVKTMLHPKFNQR